MGDVATILQNAILYVAGTAGLAKFNKAGYDMGTQRIVRPDGSIDLPMLMNVLLDVFPEAQSSAIADNVLAKYVERSREEQKPVPAAKDKPPATTVPAGKSENGNSYEDNLAIYLETESSDVRDLINEARRIRMAMGKYAPPVSAAAVHPARAPVPVEPVPVQNLPSTSARAYDPARTVAPEKTDYPVPRQDLPEAEIKQFVEAGKSYTSVDIMDFIRYLKDKGYHFQENIVLEKVYTLLGERKSRERAMLMADIQGFLERMPWPSEDDVAAYVDRKKNEGMVYESTEIKRMILVEMIRKH